jgi:hypothetical protein
VRHFSLAPHSKSGSLLVAVRSAFDPEADIRLEFLRKKAPEYAGAFELLK